ncbi:hypothetical protein NDU88_003166 [Pleurodeles waltl]|uniref:Uncharacterized protein n=1 Tax=Pleurodeles waltl TaxID=8319 RepID=A0AAV7QBE1_PLEWA|nr:hypothetical protein NDU88_003166 [Pleurodeles waltl]
MVVYAITAAGPRCMRKADVETGNVSPTSVSESWLRAERGLGKPGLRASGCCAELRGIAGGPGRWEI